MFFRNMYICNTIIKKRKRKKEIKSYFHVLPIAQSHLTLPRNLFPEIQEKGKMGRSTRVEVEILGSIF